MQAATHEIVGLFALALGLVAVVSVFTNKNTATVLSATFGGVKGLQSGISGAASTS